MGPSCKPGGLQGRPLAHGSIPGWQPASPGNMAHEVAPNKCHMPGAATLGASTFLHPTAGGGCRVTPGTGLGARCQLCHGPTRAPAAAAASLTFPD